MKPHKKTVGWVSQAQYAGYFAAQDAGYYTSECLDLTILSGGPGVDVDGLLSTQQVTFVCDHLSGLVSSRLQYDNLIAVGQV